MALQGFCQLFKDYGLFYDAEIPNPYYACAPPWPVGFGLNAAPTSTGGGRRRLTD